MYIPNFYFLVQFEEELCKKQTQKMRKTDQKTTFLGLWGGAMELKSWGPYKSHSGPLLNVRIVFLQGQEENPHIFLPNWPKRLIFRYTALYKFGFSIDWLKMEQFLRFRPLNALSSKLRHYRILTQGYPHSSLNLAKFRSNRRSSCWR